MPVTVGLIYQGDDKEKTNYQALLNAFEKRKGFLGYLFGLENPNVKLKEMPDGRVMIALTFESEEERDAFFQAERHHLPRGVSLSPDIQLVYQNNEHEKLKYRALMQALNRKVDVFNYWLGSPRATVKEETDDKVTIALHFENEEERKSFLQAERAHLPQGVNLPPNLQLIYRDTPEEKVKYQALIEALNWKRGRYNYWFGSPRATIAEQSHNKVRVALSFESEEERKTFLHAERTRLPEGVSLSPDIRLIYQDTPEETAKYQALMKALNRKIGMLDYLLGRSRATASKLHDGRVAVALKFESEEERKLFLQAESLNLPQGVNLPPNVKLVYRNTPQEQEKYRAVMDTLNQKTDTYNYWFGRPRATIEKMSNDKVVVTLNFNSAEERNLFLNSEKSKLPGRILLTQKAIRQMDLLPEGEFQKDIAAMTLVPTPSLQDDIKALTLAPAGEFQEAVEGRGLSPEQQVQKQQKVEPDEAEQPKSGVVVTKRDDSTPKAADTPKPASAEKPETKPATSTNEWKSRFFRYKDLPTEVQEDIEAMRKKLEAAGKRGGGGSSIRP